jgi:hypothetical protein
MNKAIHAALLYMLFITAYETGYSQQLVYKTIIEAVDNGNIADVKSHLKNGADVNAKDINGRTPLMRAAEKGDLPMIKYLVEKSADVNAQDNNGMTPLNYAIVKEYPEAVKYLSSKGAVLNVEVLPSALASRKAQQGELVKEKTKEDKLALEKAQNEEYIRRQNEISIQKAREDILQQRAAEEQKAIEKKNHQEYLAKLERDAQQAKLEREARQRKAHASSIDNIGSRVLLNNSNAIVIIGTIISVLITIIGILAAIINREQDNKGRKIRYAVTSMILSIFGTSIAICCILGIIFGHISLAKAKNNATQYGGKIIAMTGLCLGYYTICFGIVLGMIKVMVGEQIDYILLRALK